MPGQVSNSRPRSTTASTAGCTPGQPMRRQQINLYRGAQRSSERGQISIDGRIGDVGNPTGNSFIGAFLHWRRSCEFEQ